MEIRYPFSSLLGFDLGRINTGSALFKISDKRFSLQGYQHAPTSLGYGLHVGAGAGAAMRKLQQVSGYNFLNPSGRLVIPVDGTGRGVDHVALTISAGRWLRTAVLGLTEKGSLAVGLAVIESLPLDVVANLSLAALANVPQAVSVLVESRPEIIIITGGVDAGAEQWVQQWVEVVRWACRLLPETIKPVVIYAGNPQLDSTVKQRLEPVTRLYIRPNLRPHEGETDLLPVQALLDWEILQIWKGENQGLSDLCELSKNLVGTKSFTLHRMVRYLGRAQNNAGTDSSKSGVLAVDPGGSSVTASVSLGGKDGTVSQSNIKAGLLEVQNTAFLRSVQQWTAEIVSLQEVSQYLSLLALNPSLVPETLKELALSQALARVRLQQIIKKLSDNFNWFPYDSEHGIRGHFEPMIASGSVLTNAPTPGQSMMMLLDGLQPLGVTTMVLDRQHILPLLGLIASAAPLLSVHVLQSGAFENLGTVVVPVSNASTGDTILQVQVQTNAGKDYSIDIAQGTLRRLIVPEGTSAVMEIKPLKHTDVGFGDVGKGGRLKVTGGTLGVVIDARGRPLQLPDEDEVRVEKLHQWLSILGG